MRTIQIVFLALCLIVLPSLAQQTTWELTETLRVRSIGWTYLIDYPTGWQTQSDTLYTRLAELGVDIAHNAGDRFAVEGYLIIMERFRPLELRDLGVTVDAPLADIIIAAGEIRGFATDVEMQETTFLTAPALSLRTTDDLGNHLLITASYRGIVFEMVTVFAPSAEALDAFLSTWETMLASINIEQGSIQLEDYALAFECKGEGSPTVILRSWYGYGEHGAFTSGSSSEWSLIMNPVSNETRVCFIYRRNELGIGAIQEHVEDLHNVLTIARIAPPYVLVGHYYGGMEVRVFTDEFPSEVAGMVLVNSTYEDNNQLLRDRLTPQLFYAANMYSADPDLLRLASTGSLGDIPLRIVTSEFSGWDSPEIDTVWRELQAEHIGLSSQSNQIIVANANGGDVLKRKETRDAILEVVALVRAAAGQ